MSNEKWVSYILVLGALLVLIIPWLLTNPNFYYGIDFSNTGQIGDTIGGITSPIIGLVSALIVFKAFQAQITANKLLQNERERSNIFSLFQMADESLNSLQVIGKSGKEAFDQIIIRYGNYLQARSELEASPKNERVKQNCKVALDNFIEELKRTHLYGDLINFIIVNVLQSQEKFFIELVKVKYIRHIKNFESFIKHVPSSKNIYDSSFTDNINLFLKQVEKINSG